MTENFIKRPKRQKANRWMIYFPLGVAVALILGMFVGYELYEALVLERSSFAGGSTNFRNVEEVFHYIDNRYVDDVDRSELSEEIIESTLSSLDPHSTYINKREIAKVSESLSGEFEGIGVEFRIIKDTVRVINPLPGGPSEALGILSGDMLINIEDTLVAGIGLTNNDVMSKLKGEKGTKVRIDIKRRGVKDLIPFTIKRAKIPIYSLEAGYMIDDKVGFIKLNRFSATTYEEFGEKLVELKDAGMQQLIIDVRQNGGGYLDAATNIIDELVGGRELMVYTQGRSSKRKNHIAKRDGFFEEGDLAILIDQGSASASEILAGAIQDLDRGLIFGRRSFGKGLVQEQHMLSDGSALRLTIARYYTPSGRSIQKEYEKGAEDYGDELSERYENGELFYADSIPHIDSLKFQTKSGKIVYGGGGITPDVFVPLDTVVGSDFFYIARSFIPAFAHTHYTDNKAKYSKETPVSQWIRDFKVSDKMLEDFKLYLQGEGEEEIRPSDMSANKSDLKREIKAFLAQQIYKNEGFYRANEGKDEVLQKALEYLESGFNSQASVR